MKFAIFPCLCVPLLCLFFVARLRAEPPVPEQPLTLVTVKVQSRDELVQAVRNAKPGTKVLIAPGTYAGGLDFDNLQGEKGRPIVLAAADPEKPPVIEGGAAGLHLTDPAYVELHNLVIANARANGLNIDDGGSYDSPAHHVVLRGLVLRDIGGDANHDAVKLSGLDEFVIEDCTIERWGKRGSGIDMVGCHDGVVRGSTIREGGEIAANGLQMKGGSRDIVVRRCRFENAGGRAVNLGGNTGAAYFRPKAPGYEAKDITVEDCTFVGSMAPIAFVGVDGAHVHHNTIYRPTRWVLRILQENQDSELVRCRNGRFTQNVVVFRDDEAASPINIGGMTSPDTFTFAGNLWYCANRPERTQRLVQLPSAEKDGVYGKDPLLRDPGKGDLQPDPAGPAKDVGPRRRPSE